MPFSVNVNTRVAELKVEEYPNPDAFVVRAEMFDTQSPKVYCVPSVTVQITPFAVGDEPEVNFRCAPFPQTDVTVLSTVGDVPAAVPKAMVAKAEPLKSSALFAYWSVLTFP